MSEATKDAMILITISWQALERAKQGNEQTMIADCTIVIVFASFFIEANLNHALETINKKGVNVWILNGTHGLKDKLAWFYLYASQSKICTESEFKNEKKAILFDLKKEFPGLDEIYNFRNSISHGRTVSSSANLTNAINLRIQAKSIVDKLFALAKQKELILPRTITYYEAISPSLTSETIKTVSGLSSS